MARARPDSPPLFDLDQKPDFSFERKAMKNGLWPVAGLDEAGRGPLAGPVVAAAVVLNPKRIPKGLDDSKRLTALQREALFETILKTALGVSVSSVCAEGIDRSNILKASLKAMRRALAALPVTANMALADGRDVPPGLPCECKALIKGDQRSQSIAAASIVAKVMRDRMMQGCGRADERYGLEIHMGYATERHRAAIEIHGPATRLHRLSFAPFRLVEAEELVEADLLEIDFPLGAENEKAA
ncbi:ribonuclease HII [Mesorhizobium sp. YM1C-6-2]|uniref:ribonuclease HII n=1 Tax=Mesorhizobium sp. YM1C-6-2 TaxID=1827501 RepID=UPI000EF1851E|nr:ribonuclease HII [Mesorhizobium sp. YM1C-6-2]RLP23251.1 ribonuclease HII [Mesorhizobium sp. YM1C-6-2]